LPELWLAERGRAGVAYGQSSGSRHAAGKMTGQAHPLSDSGRRPMLP
jgi:hypothetical protein